MILQRHFVHAIRSAVLRANYYARNYRRVVWLIGDGRSGTTWLSELINVRGNYREMFEPFHPPLSKRMAHLERFQYVRPDSQDKPFERLADAVFSGHLVDPRVDARNRRLRYDGLLVKDIFAHLFAKWVDEHYPGMKKVLILRHPCAVASSKLRLPQSPWGSEPVEFLRQPELIDDHLDPFVDLLKSRETPFEKLVAIWSVIHYVLLRQFKPGELHVVFYEDLCRRPELELQRLLWYLQDGVPELDDELLDQVGRPSRTTSKPADALKKHSISHWRDAVSDAELVQACRILHTFSLDRLYGETIWPNCEPDDVLASGV